MSKLPEKLGASYYEYSAMLTVLRQEIARYNKLLSAIFKSIHELNKAIKGEIMISKSSENTFNSIVLQKVPLEWEVNNAKCSDDCINLFQFFQLFKEVLLSLAKTIVFVGQKFVQANPILRSLVQNNNHVCGRHFEQHLSIFFLDIWFLLSTRLTCSHIAKLRQKVQCLNRLIAICVRCAK